LRYNLSPPRGLYRRVEEETRKEGDLGAVLPDLIKSLEGIGI